MSRRLFFGPLRLNLFPSLTPTTRFVQNQHFFPYPRPQNSSLIYSRSFGTTVTNSNTPNFTTTSTPTSTSNLTNPNISTPSNKDPPTLKDKDDKKFKLSDAFLRKFQTVEPPFGFNGLGHLVYQRTYSRIKPDGNNEKWCETVQRVVEGTYNLQKGWIEEHKLGWNAWKAQRSAQEMYNRIFYMKFLPPGRGLWGMGSPITESKGLYAALNNCAFVSTDNMKEEPSKPFVFLMDASMLGVGVGFDTKGAGQVIVKGPNPNKPPETVVISDSREGWVESVKALLDSYFHRTSIQKFDYSQIRPAGLPIKGFGGLSSGPEFLQELHQSIAKTLEKEIGQPLSVTAIVDMMNLIGRCVVSGNVRRTAEIAFGDPQSDEYVELKDYSINPHRSSYGWTSNNSVFATVGMDYERICNLVRKNGEPGFAWLSNMQSYSRMGDAPDNKDHRARGGNPCLEQTLESYELCCLVETFPNNHTSFEDFKTTLKYAYLYAKTVTLGKTHWPETNRVMLRNRRIGCSLSGVAQFITKNGINELKEWCTKGYDVIQCYDKSFSDWLAIPRSIKTTSIKPSGTVSLLAGATPGLHYPESRFYVRRVRLASNSTLIPAIQAAGYNTETSVLDENTTIVEFPIDVGENIRSADQLSMWEQLSLTAFLQRYWADNQVSCTVTFNPELEGPQLQHALQYYQYQLKSISFLPRLEKGAYPQMPYEAITEEKYRTLAENLKPLDFSINRVAVNPVPEVFCDSVSCSLDDVQASKIQ
eukprot:TRINITY_DN12759_c0_g1_i1.p1 TRINITY_DN12759_c0_g1~~TRINITY_DN12759_c0_g1_i1.p1  ORF type:complete len:756 (+),score=104.70 TRINITY_DN12759_c0_g1_i1:91-2358(+)